MSHYDKSYFDRVEARWAEDAQRRKARHEQEHRGHSFITGLLILVAFFLSLAGVAYIGGMLTGQIH